MIQLPTFSDKRQTIDWLIQNKSALIAQKKSARKDADAISFYPMLVTDSGEVVKANKDVTNKDVTKLKVRSIINTTNLLDSHGDVHIDQLWNKSLKENKSIYLVAEHDFSYKGIISDNVKAFAKQMTWHELGYNFEGTTQALVFDSNIDKADEDFPAAKDYFGRYKNGKVKNHSVGMQYVKMELAVNDDRYEKENEMWNKYFDRIANKEDALDQGYFWAVLEAKVIEGSAVVRGSNFATPTTNVEAKQDEPVNTTQKGAVDNTPIDVASLVSKYYQPKI